MKKERKKEKKEMSTDSHPLHPLSNQGFLLKETICFQAL